MCTFVSSFEIVEINPSLDPDGQSARWAALVVWNFLSGLPRRAVPHDKLSVPDS
jgi:arginase family enzyme